jgi:hypothetical protein
MAGMLASIHIAFQEHGPITVSSKPILGQTSGGQAQNVGSQTGHIDIGQDQKPAIVEHFMPVMDPGWISPSNPLVAHPDMPRRRAKSQSPEPSRRAFDQITQLRSAQGSCP